MRLNSSVRTREKQLPFIPLLAPDWAASRPLEKRPYWSRQPKRGRAGESSAQIGLEDAVVHGGEVAVDVAAQHRGDANALLAGDGAVGSPPMRLALLS